jgi:hypothetical protein
MTDYRVYLLTEAGHLVGLPQVISCNSDEEAMKHAAPMVDEFAVELWDGARIVGRIPSARKPIEGVVENSNQVIAGPQQRPSRYSGC